MSPLRALSVVLFFAGCIPQFDHTIPCAVDEHCPLALVCRCGFCAAPDEPACSSAGGDAGTAGGGTSGGSVGGGSVGGGDAAGGDAVGGGSVGGGSVGGGSVGGGSIGGGSIGGGSIGGGTIGGGSIGGGSVGGGSVGGGSVGGGSISGGPGGGSIGGGAAGGAFAGDTCQNPIALSGPGIVTGNTQSARNDYASICSTVAFGAELVYQLTVPSGVRLTATVTAIATDGGGSLSPSIALAGATACAAIATASCFDRSAPSLAGPRQTATWYNSTTASTDVLVFIDSGQSLTAGPFTLETRFDVPTSGDWCDQPTLLSDTAPVSGVGLAGFASDFENRLTTCLGDSGGDRVFRVEVPSSRRATFTITSSASQPLIASTFSSLTQCRARECTAGESFGTGSGVIHWTNRSPLRPQQMYLVVDGPPTSTSAFSVSVQFTTIPPGDICANPLTLPTTPTSYSLTPFVADYPPGEGCAVSGNTPDLTFATLLSAGTRLEVRALSDGGIPNLDLMASSCDGSPRVCGGASTFTFNPERIARFLNPQGTRSINVIASATFSDSLRISSSTTTVAPDDTCSTNVTAVTPGRLLNQTLLGFVDDYNGPDCISGNRGPDRVYRVSVPAGQRVTALASVNVSPAPGMSPAVALVPGPATNCDAPMRRCITKPFSTQQYLNQGTAPQDVFVIVGSETPVTAPAQFFLDVALLTPLRGDLCTNPIPITSGASLTQSFTGFYGEYPTCGGGTDVVYSIDVPAGRSLAVTANFSGSGGVALVPNGTDCFVSTSQLLCRSTISTAPVLATWTNSSAATVSMLIVLQTTRGSAGVSVVVQ